MFDFWNGYYIHMKKKRNPEEVKLQYLFITTLHFKYYLTLSKTKTEKLAGSSTSVLLQLLLEAIITAACCLQTVSSGSVWNGN